MSCRSAASANQLGVPEPTACWHQHRPARRLQRHVRPLRVQAVWCALRASRRLGQLARQRPAGSGVPACARRRSRTRLLRPRTRTPGRPHRGPPRRRCASGTSRFSTTVSSSLNGAVIGSLLDKPSRTRGSPLLPEQSTPPRLRRPDRPAPLSYPRQRISDRSWYAAQPRIGHRGASDDLPNRHPVVA